MIKFLTLWLTAMVRPRRAFAALQEKRAPHWGLCATLVRFVGTAATSILALDLLGRQPFVPSYLTFLSEDSYYRAEILFLPLFGVAAWLLSGAVVHLILRLADVQSDIDQLLNVIGFSLLVVMPVVWLIDWTTIALGWYGASFTIPLHALVSVWEIVLIALGFRTIIHLRPAAAAILGLIVKAGIYIPLAALFIR